MIEILDLVLNLKCTDNISLPRFAPATIRGAFGTRLKHVACIQRSSGGNCQECLLNGVCIYSYIFESYYHIENTNLEMTEPPHPFILKAQFNDKPAIYPKGSNIQWNLKLFGTRIQEMVTYIILTAEKMGNTGLGRNRGKFYVDSIIALTDSDALIIYHHINKIIKMPLPITKLKINYSTDDSSIKRITLDFTTPLRLKRQGKYIKQINFYDIIVGI